jgi:hypothetical protein
MADTALRVRAIDKACFFIKPGYIPFGYKKSSIILI